MITHKEMNLQSVLGAAADDPGRQAELFALLTLGILESLENGVLGPGDAVGVFFNAPNCRFVRERLPGKAADEVMGRGVQLPDVLEAFGPEEAQRELEREIAEIRRLCLGILEEQRLVA